MVEAKLDKQKPLLEIFRRFSCIVTFFLFWKLFCNGVAILCTSTLEIGGGVPYPGWERLATRSREEFPLGWRGWPGWMGVPCPGWVGGWWVCGGGGDGGDGVGG